jgi:hypothetical protein
VAKPARLLTAFLGLLVAALVVVAVALDRYVASEAMRARVTAAVAQALEREVRYGELELGLLPPSLVVREAFVAGATPEDAPLLEAEKVALQVALVPLLARVVLVDSLRVDGARLRLVRSGDGLVLPLPAGAPSEPGEEAPSGGMDFAIREIELRDARIALEDRQVSPPVSWELTQVDLRVRGESLDAPLQVEIEVESAGGGRIRGGGTAELDGQVELAFEFEGFPLTPITPYLYAAFAGGAGFAGSVSGTVTHRGPIARPDTLGFNIELRDANVGFREFSLRGQVALEGEVSGGVEAPTGHFEADATRAELRYGEVFVKPPGRPATVKGRIVTTPDGRLDLDDLEVKIQNAEARGRIEFRERTRVLLELSAGELEEWHSLVPALARYELSGPVSAYEVQMVTGPLQIYGAVKLDGLRVRIPDAGAVELRGGLVAHGEAIRTRDAAIVAGGQPIPVEAEVDDLEESWSYRIETGAEQVDSTQLLTTFSSAAKALSGPLSFGANLAGSLVGSDSLGESLGGRMRFEITPGRLEGISMLEATFQRFDTNAATGLLNLIPMARLSKRAVTSRLQQFYGDDFESMSATLDVAGGAARTDDFRLVTRSYHVELAGLIQFADLGLDARGRLVLGRQLSDALGGAIGLQQMPAAQQIVIPLPAVRGTLSDPQPRPDWGFFWRTLLGNLPGTGAADRLLRGLGGRLPRR